MSKQNTALTDDQIVDVLKKARGPISVDKIAKEVGSFRHKVNLQVVRLVQSGRIIEVAGAGDSPVLFSYNANGEVTAEKSSATVLHHPTSTRQRQPRTETILAEAKDTATKDAILNLSSTQEVAPLAETAPLKETVQAPVLKAVDSEESKAAKKIMILRLLTEKAGQKNAIVAEMGDVDDLLAELKQEGLVEIDFIINENVYTLSQKAVDEFPELLLDEPKAQQATAETAQEPVAVATAPVIEAKAEVIPAVQPAPAEPEARTAPATGDVSDPVMKEVIKLVEKLVAERLNGIDEQLRLAAEDRQKIESVGASVKKATNALQAALDALNEIGSVLAK